MVKDEIKDKMEAFAHSFETTKWLLVITDKDNEDVVFDNVSAKPKYKIRGNARIFRFEGTKEKIDEMYSKLKSADGKHGLDLFVGEMRDKDRMDEILKTAFGDTE
jgi:hypothetical protein